MIIKFFLPAALAALALLAGGLYLALAPKHAARLLGDSFGFDVDFTTRGTLKDVIFRGLGAGLLGYGLYLSLHAVGMLQHWRWS